MNNSRKERERSESLWTITKNVFKNALMAWQIGQRLGKIFYTYPSIIEIGVISTVLEETWYLGL